jgi:mannose-6-phosphate isomerase-like protein (cupin superfamily)
VRPRVFAIAIVVVMVTGCARHVRRVPFVDDVDAFLATHRLAAGENIRADEIGRTQGASYHLVQVRDRERPHRHVLHDLTVVVLRGHGTFMRDGERVPLREGDAAAIPRGAPHWFANEGRAPSLALVIFAPPLDAPDVVPVVDSSMERR